MSAQQYISRVHKPKPAVKIYAVGSDEARRVEALVESFYADEALSDWEYRREARHAGLFLPPAMRDTLSDFAERPEGALLFRGMRVRGVGPTPASPSRDARTRSTRMAAQTAMLLARVCHLVAYDAEGGGRLVQTGVPTWSDRNEQTFTGSNADLESHTEQAFNQTTRPDAIALGCLRGDPFAVTYWMTVWQILEYAAPETVDLLSDPVFYTRIDKSFVDGGLRDEVRGPIAVLSTDTDGRPFLTYDEDMMYSRSPRHAAALEEVKSIWRTHRHGVVLMPGDVLMLPNRVGIHGRSAYRPRFDGGDRYIARVQGISSSSIVRQVCATGSLAIGALDC